MLFVVVVIFAFAVVPLLVARGVESSEGKASGTYSTRKKKNKDKVSAKVSSVRDDKNDSESEYLGIIEFVTEYGADKASVVDEDIDSYIVTGSLNGGSVKGFDYSNKKELVYHDCRVVKKSDVTAFYKEYIESKYYYKNQPVQFVERNGQSFIEAYEGQPSFLKDFSVMEMGGNGKKYYKQIEADDPDFRIETERSKEDLKIIKYGVEPDMNSREYKEAVVDYLVNRLTKSGMKKDNLKRLVLGTYGYRIPDDGLFTDIETVFEKVIPLRYRQIEDNVLSASNFRRELVNAISNGYKSVGCYNGYTIVDNNRMIIPTREYSDYICLVLHLMLLKYHQAGKKPYCECDLSTVWKRLEESLKNECIIENHNSVYHGNVLLCGDLSQFAIEALKKLIYFRQFDRSDDK